MFQDPMFLKVYEHGNTLTNEGFHSSLIGKSRTVWRRGVSPCRHEQVCVLLTCFAPCIHCWVQSIENKGIKFRVTWEDITYSIVSDVVLAYNRNNYYDKNNYVYGVIGNLEINDNKQCYCLPGDESEIRRN